MRRTPAPIEGPPKKRETDQRAARRWNRKQERGAIKRKKKLGVGGLCLYPQDRFAAIVAVVLSLPVLVPMILFR